MFESIWLMVGASRWWKRFTGSLSAVANWVGQSPLHFVLSTLIGAIALNLWQWHERDAMAARDARQLAQWHAAIAAEQAAFQAESRAAVTLRTALASQNASIEDLSSAAKARAAGAKAALAAADAGDARLGQVAAHIRASASLPAEGGGCRTPEVVMAARNVL